MIVSSITGNSIQPKNFGFKGIYRTDIDYTESQKLKEKGFDVFLSDSFIRTDAIDVYIGKKINRKVISVGTYLDKDFNPKDIEESILEDNRIEKSFWGFTVAAIMIILLLIGVKTTSYMKNYNTEAQKVMVKDSVKTAKDTIKNVLKFN